jgi:hypothetical protein
VIEVASLDAVEARPKDDEKGRSSSSTFIGDGAREDADRATARPCASTDAGAIAAISAVGVLVIRSIGTDQNHLRPRNEARCATTPVRDPRRARLAIPSADLLHRVIASENRSV